MCEENTNVQISIGVVNYTAVKRTGIPIIDALVADYIHQLQQDPDAPKRGWCNLTNAQIAETFGFGGGVAKDIVSRLVSGNFIETNGRKNHLRRMRTTPKYYRLFIKVTPEISRSESDLLNDAAGRDTEISKSKFDRHKTAGQNSTGSKSESDRLNDAAGQNSTSSQTAYDQLNDAAGLNSASPIAAQTLTGKGLEEISGQQIAPNQAENVNCEKKSTVGNIISSSLSSTIDSEVVITSTSTIEEEKESSTYIERAAVEKKSECDEKSEKSAGKYPAGFFETRKEEYRTWRQQHALPEEYFHAKTIGQMRNLLNAIAFTNGVDKSNHEQIAVLWADFLASAPLSAIRKPITLQNIYSSYNEIVGEMEAFRKLAGNSGVKSVVDSFKKHLVLDGRGYIATVQEMQAASELMTLLSESHQARTPGASAPSEDTLVRWCDMMFGQISNIDFWKNTACTISIVKKNYNSITGAIAARRNKPAETTKRTVSPSGAVTPDFGLAPSTSTEGMKVY